MSTEQLADEMRAKHVSQQAVAVRAGVAQSNVCKMLKGHRAMTLSVASAIAELTGVGLGSRLFEGVRIASQRDVERARKGVARRTRVLS